MQLSVRPEREFHEEVPGHTQNGRPERANASTCAAKPAIVRPALAVAAIEAAGFKKYLREGITLRINESPRIDIALEVGQVTETIEVAGTAPLLETETSTSGGVIEGETVRQIAGDHGLTADVDMSGPMHAVLAQVAQHVKARRVRVAEVPELERRRQARDDELDGRHAVHEGAPQVAVQRLGRMEEQRRSARAR